MLETPPFEGLGTDDREISKNFITRPTPSALGKPFLSCSAWMKLSVRKARKPVFKRTFDGRRHDGFAAVGKQD